MYEDAIASILISETQVKQRVKQLSGEITEWYKTQHLLDESEEIILITVLKGAVFFVTDLARFINHPTQLEFMVISSYGSGCSSSGVVRILKDLDRDIAGRHVLIVEDIIDSGLTLSWLYHNLKERNPKTLKIVSLLRKATSSKMKIPIDWVGFDIPNNFVVGYGLDFNEKYRDIPFIATLKASVYE